MLRAAVDVKQDALRLSDVVAIQQRRVQRVHNSLLHPVRATRPPHRHDGSATILHRRLHVAEVTLDASVTRHRYQLRNTLHGIHQHVVCPLEGILQRYVRIRIHVAQPFVVHYQQRVHVLAQLVHTLQRLDNLALLLKVERYRHHTHRQQSHPFGNASHHRRSTGSRAAPHAGSHKHHLRAVRQQFLYILRIVLSLPSAQFRIRPSPEAGVTQHDLHRHRRARQRLAVRVTDGKRHSLHTLVIHVLDCITATAPDTYHLDDALHLVLHRTEEI